jgi:hypothetical protein
VGIVSIVIACLALAFSAAIFVRDNHRYRIRLQIRIPYYWVLWNKGNRSLVLFHLWFVNQSLRGRTVARVLIKLPIGIAEMPFVWGYDEDYKNVAALLANSEQTNSLPIHEVLLGALDIPPHQSQCKWVGYYLELSPRQNAEIETEAVNISFFVRDIDDNFLAGLQIPVTLAKLRTVAPYYTTEMRGVHPLKWYAKLWRRLF